jgi:hypothetical protein
MAGCPYRAETEEQKTGRWKYRQAGRALLALSEPAALKTARRLRDPQLSLRRADLRFLS